MAILIVVLKIIPVLSITNIIKVLGYFYLNRGISLFPFAAMHSARLPFVHRRSAGGAKYIEKAGRCLVAVSAMCL